METYRVYMTPDAHTDIEASAIKSNAGNIAITDENGNLVATFYNATGWEVLPPREETGIPTRPS